MIFLWQLDPLLGNLNLIGRVESLLFGLITAINRSQGAFQGERMIDRLCSHAHIRCHENKSQVGGRQQKTECSGKQVQRCQGWRRWMLPLSLLLAFPWSLVWQVPNWWHDMGPVGKLLFLLWSHSVSNIHRMAIQYVTMSLLSCLNPSNLSNDRKSHHLWKGKMVWKFHSCVNCDSQQWFLMEQ